MRAYWAIRFTDLQEVYRTVRSWFLGRHRLKPERELLRFIVEDELGIEEQELTEEDKAALEAAED